MQGFSVLLKQMKEKEEQDLAYAKKIKEVEGLLKAEKDNLKKLKLKQNKLIEEIKRKTLKCSREEITRLELLHLKAIWEDLLQEMQNNLSQSEADLDGLQQSICSNRLSFCKELRSFLHKYDFLNSFRSDNEKTGLLCGVPKLETNEEKDDESKENLPRLIIALENQLRELKVEKVQIEEAKVLKGKLEAEPTCGKEFLRYQNMLFEAKDKLKKAEEEERHLKMTITQKEVLLLKKRSLPTEERHTYPSASGNSNDSLLSTKTEVNSITTPQECSIIPKTVTFNGTVEMKTISPTSKYKTAIKSKSRPKSPSEALRNTLTRKPTRSKLDETMREILFKDQNYQ